MSKTTLVQTELPEQSHEKVRIIKAKLNITVSEALAIIVEFADVDKILREVKDGKQ